MSDEKESTKELNTPRPKVDYQDIQWWNAWTKDQEPHTILPGHIKGLRDKQAIRYTNIRKLNSIYEWGFKASTYDTIDEQPISEFMNASNAAAHTVDVVHSKVFKNRLVPMPMTTGGGALQQKRALDLGKALDGLYDENEMDMIEEDAGYDALICGLGFAKTYTEFGRAKARFVPCDDMTMDDAEGRYRAPRSMFETQRMDRFQALEIYGGDEEWLHGDQAARRKAILDCKEATADGGQALTRDQISVHEAYHLPSGPDAGDGRLSIVIDNCTLVDVEWKRPRFRHHKMLPMPRRRSSWGLSMMHELAAPQNEYEWVTAGIQKKHHKMGGSHYIAPRSANLTERDLDNGVATLTEYDGNVPVREWNPEPCASQTYQYQASLPDSMLTRYGVSTMSAHGEVPTGAANASGIWLQTSADIEAEGLRSNHAARRRFHKSIAQGFIDEMRDIMDSDDAESYEVAYSGKGVTEMVDWKKVLLDEADYVLTIPSINALSQTVAARKEQIAADLTAGLLTPDEARRLNGDPDRTAMNALSTADDDIILQNLDKMVTEGRYLAPQSFDNLQRYVELAGKFYNLERAKDKDGANAAGLQMIRDAIAEAKALIEEAKAATAPPPPPPGAMPPPGGPPMGGPPPPDMGMPPGMPPGGMPPPDMGPPPGMIPPPMGMA